MGVVLCGRVMSRKRNHGIETTIEFDVKRDT